MDEYAEMKRWIPFATVVALIIAAFVTVAAIGGRFNMTSLAPFEPEVEIVLTHQPPVDVRLVAVGPEDDRSWYVVGQFEFPGYINVSRLVVESYPDGPVRCVGVLLGTDLRRATDTTTYETFAFGVHAGVLRRVVEMDGMARFIVHGEHTRVVIDMTVDGEKMIIDALPPPRERQS